MEWSNGLTETQHRAASYTGTHARLLAGPGTGKTLVLTRRILFLIQEKQVNPQDILVLTFTRVAARELRQRITDALNKQISGITITTLHSFALSLLLKHGAGDRLPQPIRIADDWEEKKIIRQDLKRELGLPKVKQAEELLNRLSANWEQLGDPQRELCPRFYGAWQKHREVFGYTLRAEMVYQLLHALEEGALQIKYPPKYILVDEYQDLNPCELKTLKRITELTNESSLYVAGDDDQSIYGFRYAAPEGIRNFDKDYTPSDSLNLTECHRCGHKILELAQYVIQQDHKRLSKDICAASGLAPGEVHILKFINQHPERRGIAEICRWLVNSQKVQPNEILILLREDRNRAFSTPIREALEKQGLSAGIVSNPLECFEKTEGRKFLSILRLVVNPKDHLAWRTLLEIDKDYKIGPKTLGEIYDKASNDGKRFYQVLSDIVDEPTSITRGKVVARACKEIKDLVSEASSKLESEGIEGIPSLIEQLIKDPKLQEEILGLFQRVIDMASPKNLDELLRALTVSMGDKEQEQQRDSINIMTMHQAKGLSATAVFIVGAEQELIPGRAKGSEIDDERRLLYVSLTRAKQYLYITFCLERLRQQAYSGKDSGKKQRRLTSFLSGGPVTPKSGTEFVSTLNK